MEPEKSSLKRTVVYRQPVFRFRASFPECMEIRVDPAYTLSWKDEVYLEVLRSPLTQSQSACKLRPHIIYRLVKLHPSPFEYGILVKGSLSH